MKTATAAPIKVRKTRATKSEMFRTKGNKLMLTTLKTLNRVSNLPHADLTPKHVADITDVLNSAVMRVKEAFTLEEVSETSYTGPGNEEVNKVLNSLSSIAELSEYEYTTEQVEKITTALDSAVERVTEALTTTEATETDFSL
jgi:hypothetical protein